jgi:hypothetical protein
MLFDFLGVVFEIDLHTSFYRVEIWNSKPFKKIRLTFPNRRNCRLFDFAGPDAFAVAGLCFLAFVSHPESVIGSDPAVALPSSGDYNVRVIPGSGPDCVLPVVVVWLRHEKVNTDSIVEPNAHVTAIRLALNNFAQTLHDGFEFGMDLRGPGDGSEKVSAFQGDQRRLAEDLNVTNFFFLPADGSGDVPPGCHRLKFAKNAACEVIGFLEFHLLFLFFASCFF